MFPDFSTQLRDAMVHESEMLFQHLVREDKSRSSCSAPTTAS
jgi:hypothetical protein